MASLIADSTRGVIPPVITPLRQDGAVDTDGLVRLVGSVVAAGASGVLVLGSTGEGGHLCAGEQEEVVAAALRAAAGIPVIAAVPALSTRAAESLAVRLEHAGAHAILSAPTFGFDLSQDEVADHFRRLRAAVSVPLLAYQVPSRAPTSLAVDTIALLAHDGVIVGVKDSSGDLDSHRAYADATADLPGFIRMSGNETDLTASADAGFGVFVPGLSNLFASVHVALVAALSEGDRTRARELDADLARYARLYQTPDGRAGRTSRAIGALKEALRQQGIIASATMAAPMLIQDNMGAHVQSFLADVSADHLAAAR